MIGELKNKDAELCVDEVNVYYVEDRKSVV